MGVSPVLALLSISNAAPPARFFVDDIFLSMISARLNLAVDSDQRLEFQSTSRME
jgi:hypothetical protein